MDFLLPVRLVSLCYLYRLRVAEMCYSDICIEGWSEGDRVRGEKAVYPHDGRRSVDILRYPPDGISSGGWDEMVAA